jgi:hypothetical protein
LGNSEVAFFLIHPVLYIDLQIIHRLDCLCKNLVHPLKCMQLDMVR